MPVIVETATVYRGAGRRYFTKTAALRSFAKAAMRKRCECDEDDPSIGYGGYQCKYHNGDGVAHKIIDRFCGIYRNAIQKEGGKS